MKLFAVRGAIDVPIDTPEAVSEAVQTLMAKLIEVNQVELSSILSIFFTTTPDIHSQNPATALRLAFPDWPSLPLLCSQEPVITGMFPACIRVLIQWQVQDTETVKITPLYLGKAAQLRPDLDPNHVTP